MVTRITLLVCLAAAFGNETVAQSNACTFKPPFYTLHFGKGTVTDVNAASLAVYNRVVHACPGDGHYTYASSLPGCFGDDWHSLPEDHTPGDAGGNMLVVNAAYEGGTFLVSRVKGFKPGTTYQFGMWVMNVCKPTKKCPFRLLPNMLIRLQTPGGKTVASFVTGEVPRIDVPKWTQHRAQFTMPGGETELVLTMIDDSPGGCGNDFVLDDITFQECRKPEPEKLVQEKKVPQVITPPAPVVAAKKATPPVKKEAKQSLLQQKPLDRNSAIAVVAKSGKLPAIGQPELRPQPASFVPLPVLLRQRTNALARQIETEAGEIRIDLYDNGTIDDDTVTIYHNNTLVVAEQRLSKKPITLHLQVDRNDPHHEVVMVANNLGSIPPNTSLMIVTAKSQRYQVSISSTEQQNAKVVIQLKE